MNTETKRHIDAARQVLVGVVPNPTSQIDQITNALIYKFMDDMDQAAIKAGGEPTFFVGDLESYAWTRLMDTTMGHQERMNLYSEALIKFSEAKQLPDLFRGIFKSAFLPYRSPETLGLFLKEIDYFDYSHPEELGNAYEYLLSIMSSQGDAGQFRTPRHLIDFIVDVVNPTKDDKVLDPACGTGGFLVSSYKHILEQHDGINDPEKKEKPLTPDERKKLMTNFEGYDIDPTMARISQVNMYLHQFKNPKIYQYDSLSSDERWNDKFDVILANPPFMSPKGGIKPHSKFSIQSSRSEVLFVDYIMNHLRPKGRAGIVVPEGIIFQSGKAHKELRKNLVNDGLYAVVSLPSGVFAPYSGVKTSVLLFDNELAKRSEEILFVKIEDDGFDLGATKRPIDKNDLPAALDILNKWRDGKKVESKLSVYVKKTQLAESGDYNLSGDRYRVVTDYTNAKWPMVALEEVAEIQKGSAITKKDTVHGGVPVIAGGQEPAYYHNVSNREGEIITVSASGAYAGFVNFFNIPIFASDCSTVQSKDETTASTKYLSSVLKAKQEDIYAFQQGGGQPHVYPKDLKTIKIPLPPLEIQEQIVEELDGYSAIIAGARQIVQNWKPEIDDVAEFPLVKVGDVVNFVSGVTLAIGDCEAEDGIPIITIADVAEEGVLNLDNIRTVKTTKKVNFLEKGDLLFNWRNGSKKLVGKTAYFDLDGKYIFASFLLGIRPDKEKVENKFLWYLLNKYRVEGKYMAFMRQNVNGLFNREELKEVEIPLPTLKAQKQIVEKIEAERALVESAKKLIDIYDQKTKDAITKLWTE